MEALVLEEKGKLALRDFDIPGELGPRDVRIKTHTVGICGSDVHYYTHGKIGHFVVNEPMVLGHEASGTVIACGDEVTDLKPGDRVCMEPGIPDPDSRASKLGIYNVDPAVRFWATPPVHGCLTPEVIHPAAFTYKLPESVSFAEGAMVEPFAIGMQAALRARIQPGDIAVVTGAGPIGMMVALAALAGGCAKVIVADLAQPKLDIIAAYDGIETVNIKDKSAADAVAEATDGWGTFSRPARRAPSTSRSLPSARPASSHHKLSLPLASACDSALRLAAAARAACSACTSASPAPPGTW